MIEAEGSERRHPGGRANPGRQDGSVEVRPVRVFAYGVVTSRRSRQSMAAERVRERIEAIYRSDSRRVLATLIRLLGDFDLRRGSDARRVRGGARSVAARRRPGQSARVARLDRAVQGDRPAAARRPVRRRRSTRSGAIRLEAAVPPDVDDEDDGRRGRPSAAHLHVLPSGARSRRAHRAHAPRSVRARNGADRARVPDLARRRSRSASCARRPRSATPAFPIRCRRATELSERLDAVLHVIYLVFNEGYSASAGDTLTRARSVGRSDPAGTAARRAAAGARSDRAARADAAARRAARRADVAGRRDRAARRAGSDAAGTAPRSRRAWRSSNARCRRGASGPTRCRRRSPPFTPRRATARRPTGRRSSGSTTSCCALDPSPVVELNRAAAIAMRDGPAAGLALIDAILARGDLADYHLAFSARADLCRRLGRTADAIAAYERALALTTQLPERRFIERRLAELRQA